MKGRKIKLARLAEYCAKGRRLTLVFSVFHDIDCGITETLYDGIYTAVLYPKKLVRFSQHSREVHMSMLDCHAGACEVGDSSLCLLYSFWYWYRW